MDIETINKHIQQEKDRHNRKINKLKLDIGKENIHHQREMEYLQSQKTKCSNAPIARLEAKIEIFDKNINALLETIKQAYEE